jgi:hypothetical protein
MTDPSGVTTYNYDPLTDRLTAKQTPFGNPGTDGTFSMLAGCWL